MSCDLLSVVTAFSGVEEWNPGELDPSLLDTTEEKTRGPTPDDVAQGLADKRRSVAVGGLTEPPSVSEIVQAGVGPRGNGAAEKVSVALYDEMFTAWAQKPSINAVSKTCHVPYRLAKRIITQGIPRLGLPPFPGSGQISQGKMPGSVDAVRVTGQELTQAAAEVEAVEEVEALEARLRKGLSAYEEEARKIEAEIARLGNAPERQSTLNEFREAFGKVCALERTLERITKEGIAADQTRKAAQEAAGSRLALRNAVSIAAILANINEHVLDAIQSGKMTMPKELTPRLISMLARSSETVASAVDKAMTIERKRVGAPEKIIGVEIATLISGCTQEELDDIASTGQLSSRVISAVPGLMAPVAVEAEIVEMDSGEPNKGND